MGSGVWRNQLRRKKNFNKLLILHVQKSIVQLYRMAVHVILLRISFFMLL
ncbi:hypothetical protein HID58_028697 [Brassica napus]|uniref:Uncharacterized protein n=1 Tax=Brassica napus TaxID=3708 RepID=A0ABQ8CAZ6_BRANA|nr:hypothetical protein HID58_028697 [Brassica napus]